MIADNTVDWRKAWVAATFNADANTVEQYVNSKRRSFHLIFEQYLKINNKTGPYFLGDKVFFLFFFVCCWVVHMYLNYQICILL